MRSVRLESRSVLALSLAVALGCLHATAQVEGRAPAGDRLADGERSVCERPAPDPHGAVHADDPARVGPSRDSREGPLGPARRPAHTLPLRTRMAARASRPRIRRRQDRRRSLRAVRVGLHVPRLGACGEPDG
jgi:hypothetical protein